MKKIYSKMVFFFLILSLIITCNKEDDNSDSKKSATAIEWVNPSPDDITSVYHYAGGACTGQSFNLKFKVLNKSGEISFTIQEKSLNLTKTTTFNVESGKQYKMTANINYSSQSGVSTATKFQTFTFSSPNCNSTKEIYIYQVRVNVGGYPACPNSFSIGDVSISPVN